MWMQIVSQRHFRNLSAGSSATDKSFCYCRTLSSEHSRNVTSTCAMHLLNATQTLTQNRRLLFKRFLFSFSVLFLFMLILRVEYVCLFVWGGQRMRSPKWQSFLNFGTVCSKEIKEKYTVNKHCSVSHWHCKLTNAKQSFLLLWAS